MIAEALKGINVGIMIGGERLADIRFADDQGMLAESESELQIIMNRVHEIAKKYGMRINVKKTKSMRVSRSGGGVVRIVVDGQQVEQVCKFKYLGSWITDDVRCQTEIRARIAMAKEAFSKRREILIKNFDKTIKKKMVKSLV